ncbi:hypothetical protein [Bradyrhizobium australafricanum]|uniref:hypothetical protein n=1 Tax=Bradyrhizobium australafricanum TaxID=2821406 RepID=UPI001CE28D7E|nr:hypothetical protein [Bradyrhizobium australafricanum]MCA6098859.1 hypothetical protein [Bradyrhizobium australafricanum]
MVDNTYSTKVYEKQGGKELVVASGGQLTVESGGKVVVTLPTADPHVVGQLWANAGVVTVSAG